MGLRAVYLSHEHILTSQKKKRGEQQTAHPIFVGRGGYKLFNQHHSLGFFELFTRLSGCCADAIEIDSGCKSFTGSIVDIPCDALGTSLHLTVDQLRDFLAKNVVYA